MIQLTDTIFAVEVPTNVTDFKTSRNQLWGYSELGGFMKSKIKHIYGLSGVYSDRFKILGTVTPTEIDFDVEPYVECNRIFETRFFADYTKDESNWFDEPTESAESSFMTLLTSKGITTYEKLVIVELIK